MAVDLSDHWGSARAAVSPSIGQEIPVALEPEPNRRGDDRMAYHRKMVERVMEAEWKTDDEGVRPDFDIGIVLQHLTGVKGVEARAFRQRALVDFDDGDIDAAGHVGRIPPDALAIVEEKDRKPRRAREIVLVDVNLELQSVGMMIVLGVDDDMQAGDEEQAIAVLEKKAGCVGQQPVADEG